MKSEVGASEPMGARETDISAKGRRPADPAIGDTVIVGLETEVNGQWEAPGIVTAVWGPSCINARVLTDSSNPPLWKTSVEHQSTVGAPAVFQQSVPAYWRYPYESRTVAIERG